MKYFTLLPKIEYANAIITNLFYTYQLVSDIDPIYLFDYRVKSGETLESIAYAQYDNARLWWVLALINDIHDVVFDFVIDDALLREDAENQATTDGVLDHDKFLEIYETLSDQNEAKRDIKILSLEYLNTFLTDIVELSPTDTEYSLDIDAYTYNMLSTTTYDAFFEQTDNIIETNS